MRWRVRASTRRSAHGANVWKSSYVLAHLLRRHSRIPTPCVRCTSELPKVSLNSLAGRSSSMSWFRTIRVARTVDCGFIFAPILGFGSDTYRGPAAAQAA